VSEVFFCWRRRCLSFKAKERYARMARLLLAIAAFLACSASAFSCSSLALSQSAACGGAVSRSACAGGALTVTAGERQRVQPGAVVMAVPKKRQSKMKTRQRKANWFAKARRQATLALNRAKSVNYDPLEDPKYSFDAPEEDDDDDDDEEEEE